MVFEVIKFVKLHPDANTVFGFMEMIFEIVSSKLDKQLRFLYKHFKEHKEKYRALKISTENGATISLNQLYLSIGLQRFGGESVMLKLYKQESVSESQNDVKKEYMVFFGYLYANHFEALIMIEMLLKEFNKIDKGENFKYQRELTEE